LLNNAGDFDEKIDAKHAVPQAKVRILEPPVD
jgi:hypothetical protein